MKVKITHENLIGILDHCKYDDICIEAKIKGLISSSEIAIIIEAAKIHHELFGKKLRINKLSDTQKEIFRIIKLDNILEY